MRIPKKYAYPLFTVPSFIYLIYVIVVFVYRGFDNSIFKEQSHQIAIVASVIIIVRAIFWYSDNGGFKKYISHVAGILLGLLVIAGVITLFNWIASLF
tara:strand:+ start:90 stop:383 length:294 start_codon:yes stop_codon:yes gene_type:complete